MSATATRAAEPQRMRSMAGFASSWASQLGITVAFLVLWLAFIIAAPRTFTSSLIYISFATTVPYTAIMALFLTMVIIAGDMDLSFGSEMSLSMVGFVWVWQATGSAELGFLAALVVGAACGLFNGVFVTLVGIPSLIVTVGTLFLFQGLTLVLMNGRQVPLVTTNSSPTYAVLVGQIGSIPMQFIWLIVLAIGAWALLNRHRLGQNTYVIGDNLQAAGLMGIPIRQTRVILFVLVGLASAVAGVMNSLAINNFYLQTGSGYLLPTIAAVFVGGTSAFGGRGTIYGTFIGAFMIGGIQAGIVAAGLTDYYTQAIYGAVILLALTIHAVLQRRFQ
jgi:simple sugar transport system permease protein